MDTIPYDQIKLSIETRQRQHYDQDALEKLSTSIRRYGVLEPIIIDSDNQLIAGCRRYLAAKLAGLAELPFVRLSNLSPTQREEIELEENIRRENITWQERCLAIARIHDLHLSSSMSEGLDWSFAQTGELVDRVASNVYYCVAVAELLKAKDPDALKCATFKDAILLLAARKESQATALLTAKTTIAQKADTYATRRYTKDGTAYTASESLGDIEGKPYYGYDIDGKPVFDRPVESPRSDVRNLNPGVRCDDLLSTYGLTPVQRLPDLTKLAHIARRCSMTELFPGIEPGTIAHIYCDPPYAINMDNIQQDGVGMVIDSVRDEHDVDRNMNLLALFLKRAYDVLPDTGFCALWCDQAVWQFLVTTAENVGFHVQRWPLIWVKTHPCQNGAALYNFTKTTECCMLLRKSSKAILKQHRPTSHYIGASDKTEQKAQHPFWKPLALHKWILNAIALPGETILDPFAGEGSIPQACLTNGYNVIAYECNDIMYPLLVERLTQFV